jgi:hypothetical protein
MRTFKPFECGVRSPFLVLADRLPAWETPFLILPPRLRARIAVRLMGPFTRAALGRPGTSLRRVLVRGWWTGDVAGFLSVEIGPGRVGALYVDRDHGGMLHLREVLGGQYEPDPIAYLRKALGRADPDRAAAEAHEDLVADMDGFSQEMDWFTRDLVADAEGLFRHDRPRMRTYAMLRIGGHTPTAAARRLRILPTSVSRMERRYRARLQEYLSQA